MDGIHVFPEDGCFGPERDATWLLVSYKIDSLRSAHVNSFILIYIFCIQGAIYMFPDSLFLTICSLLKYGIFNFLDPFPAYNLGTPYCSKLQSSQKSNPFVTPIPYIFSCSLTNTVPGFSSYPRGAQLRQYNVFVPKPSYKSPVAQEISNGLEEMQVLTLQTCSWFSLFVTAK